MRAAVRRAAHPGGARVVLLRANLNHRSAARRSACSQRRAYSANGNVTPTPAAPTNEPVLHIPLQRVRGGKDDLVQKIKGIFYGCALGDAIGRIEGEARSLKRNVTPLLLPPGSWTSNTEQLLVMADSIASTCAVLPRDFAKRLHQWQQHGLPDAKVAPGPTHDKLLQAVLATPNYTDSPISAAKRVWEASEKVPTNGALARSAALGAVEMLNAPAVVSNSKFMCMTTHADQSCVASSVLLASFIAAMLRGGIKLGAPVSELRPVMQLSVGLGIQELENEKQTREFQKYTKVTSLADLKLSDNPLHVYKALGAGLFALLNFKSFEEGISRVALAGGEPTTNTAVAGALLGAHYGYKALPQAWLSAVSRLPEIDVAVDRYLKALGL